MPWLAMTKPPCTPRLAWWRSLARLLLAAASAALPLGLAALSCGTDAVGVDACRQIETARCNLAPACGMPSFDVGKCTRFYRDECLLGIANASDGGGSTDPTACITALQGCAAVDASTAPGCPGQASHPGAKCLNGLVEIPSPTACDIVLHCPEVLEVFSIFLNGLTYAFVRPRPRFRSLPRCAGCQRTDRAAR